MSCFVIIDFPKGDHRRPPYLGGSTVCASENVLPFFPCFRSFWKALGDHIWTLGLVEVTFGIWGGIRAQFGSQKLLFGSLGGHFWGLGGAFGLILAPKSEAQAFQSEVQHEDSIKVAL